MNPENKENHTYRELKGSHTPAAIRERIADGGNNHSYLKDFIYGAIDGAVTTFAVVSGVAGANLSSQIVIILGMANLIGDGFSMAVSNFLGTRAEDQLRTRARENEEKHIHIIPEGEKEEIRQIYAAKGFEAQELERIVEVITSDRQEWVNTMMKEELGMTLKGPSPVRAGLATLAAFILIGSLPLISFLFQWAKPDMQYNPYIVSAVITGIAFFIVGALKSRFVGQKWYKAGLETFAIGGSAAFLAYIIGVMLKGIVLQ